MDRIRKLFRASRSRLVVAFVAVALFLAPAKAQEVTIGINECWAHCHMWVKAVTIMFPETTDEQAQELFVMCMDEHCGGMGGAS